MCSVLVFAFVFALNLYLHYIIICISIVQNFHLILPFSHRGHVLRARELCPLRIHRRRLQNQNPLIGVWWGPSSPSPLQSRQTWQNTPSAPLQEANFSDGQKLLF